MAWYSDKHKLSHTQTYADRAAATKEAQRAADYGWQVEDQTSPSGPATDPIWASGGSVATFVAGAHTPGDIVVTYVRREDWKPS